MALYAALFPGFTCAIPGTAWTQVDQTHWVLDVSSSVTPDYTNLKEVSIFLTAPNCLPPDAALSLYVSVGGGSEWSFRGYISNNHPSDVLPVTWPEPQSTVANPRQPGFAQIGVSLEPLSEASVKESAKLGAKEDFCRRVGMDLFNFMQSFGNVTTVGTDKLLVPANVLDQWFIRISNRLKRDPDFLTRQKDVI